MEEGLLDLSAVLIYPNTRDVAFSSLGFLKVHGMLAARATVADIAYLPGPLPSPVVSRKQSLLIGERTGWEAGVFDIIAFSVSYENDYMNVVRLLEMAGIEPLHEKRRRALPLVLMGGFTMFMNSRPLAPFADAIVVGEAEAVLCALLAAVDKAKREGWARDRLLERLSELKGVMVPSMRKTRVERVWAGVGSFAPEPMELAGSPGLRDSHFGDMRLVEVGRGCGRGCLFCAAGCLYRPVRMREAGEVLKMAEGASRVGLVGPAVADHPEFLTMLGDLVGRGAQIGVSSLRADRVTRRLAGLLASGGMKTATIAPEAGSEELRRNIGKALSDEQVVAGVRLLAEAGIPTIKLYFMMGLPGETDADVEAIVELVRDMAGVRGKSRLSVSVAPFVPKPGTPFEDEPFADMETLRRRATLLKDIRNIKGCTLKVAALENAWLEAVLSRADESVGPLILEAVRKGVKLRTLLRRSGVRPGDRHRDR
jgi:radical SAM superfamily enzyme YgiQ (UPF0313 family)